MVRFGFFRKRKSVDHSLQTVSEQESASESHPTANQASPTVKLVLSHRDVPAPHFGDKGDIEQVGTDELPVKKNEEDLSLATSIPSSKPEFNDPISTDDNERQSMLMATSTSEESHETENSIVKEKHRLSDSTTDTNNRITLGPMGQELSTMQLETIRKMASSGHAAYQFKLASLYERGISLNQDLVMALYWYNKARQQGSLDAQKKFLALRNGNRTASDNVAQNEEPQLDISACVSDVKAQVNEADCFYKKALSNSDLCQARELLRIAAEKGHTEAQEKLAEMLFFGIGGSVDYKKAVGWYLIAGPSDGEPEAHLAQCYKQLGYLDEAADWFEIAALHGVSSASFDCLKIRAEAGNSEAQYLLGVELSSDGATVVDLKDALAWLATAAKNGNFNAQKKLVDLYLDGENVVQDISNAMYWYKRADLCDCRREFFFAEHCKAVNRKDDAIYWYKQADIHGHEYASVCLLKMLAGSGDVEAQYDLASAYIRGNRIERDIGAAAKWMARAAESGLAKAQYELGKILLTEPELNAQNREAVLWLELAAYNGVYESKKFLAEAYLKGDYFAADPVIAAQWFERLNEKDSAFAFTLGEMFSSRGFPKDALRWFERADRYGHSKAGAQCLLTRAALGNSNDQYNLAKAYAKGSDGFEQSDSKAAEWYTKAAKQGHVGAQNELNCQLRNSNGVAQKQQEAVQSFRRVVKKKDHSAQSDSSAPFQYKSGIQNDAHSDFRKAAEQKYETERKQTFTAEINQNNRATEKRKLRPSFGDFFGEGSLISDWLHSLNEVGPGLSWTKVATLGSGPFQLDMMDSILWAYDLTPCFHGDVDASILIIGRDDWTEEGIEAHIAARAGESLHVYSQEMAMLALLTKNDLFELDEELLLEFGRGHPALEHLMEHEFTWPVITQGWHDIHVDGEAWHAGSPLTAVGYHVGVSSPLTSQERRRLLENIFKGRLVFPADFTPSEQIDWGRPGSMIRLEKMAMHIARQISLRHNRPNFKIAVREWQEDLDWMKKFYSNKSRFGWPG